MSIKKFKVKRKFSLDTANMYLVQAGSKVKVISVGKKRSDKCEFLCLNCDYKFFALFRLKVKCKGCHKPDRIVTEELAHKRLEGRSLVMISWGGGTIKKASFKCKICDYVWDAVYSCVENKKNGCPRCAPTYKVSVDHAEEFLRGIGINLIKWGGTTHKYSTFECNTCQTQWVAKYNNIYNGTRCPSCKIGGGFNPIKPAYVYVILINTIHGDCYGFGVTNNYEVRIRAHKKNLGDVIIQEYPLRYFDSGGEAKNLESLWKKSPFRVNINVTGFKTECVLANAETTRMLFS